MSRKTIKELKEGESTSSLYLLSNVTKGLTNAGAPYLSLVFQDHTGTIDAKLWDANAAQTAIAQPGAVLLVNAEVLKYRNALQLRINGLEKPNEEFSLSDFVVSSSMSEEELRSVIFTAVESMGNPIYKEIIQTLIKERENDFFQYPAASRIHHDFVGGLAQHICGMLSLAGHLCSMYPTINRDLLLSGVILHDYGKLDELSGAVMTEYTVEGKLLGHISIMQAEVYRVAEKLGYQNSEETTLLRHMILSHHGEYEFGSPVLPLIMEAECLSFIDNLDARINMMEKALQQIEPGEFTPKIFSLENRTFYKPKGGK